MIRADHQYPVTLSLRLQCRLLDLAWLDDDGCAVLHRVAEKNDLPFFDLLVEERKRSPERRAQIDLEAR